MSQPLKLKWPTSQFLQADVLNVICCKNYLMKCPLLHIDNLSALFQFLWSVIKRNLMQLLEVKFEILPVPSNMHPSDADWERRDPSWLCPLQPSALIRWVRVRWDQPTNQQTNRPMEKVIIQRRRIGSPIYIIVFQDFKTKKVRRRQIPGNFRPVQALARLSSWGLSK